MKAIPSKKKYIIRALMIVPPVLFVLYTGQSFRVIRGLLSDSSEFHQEYANELIQDYLNLEMDLAVARLENCVEWGTEPCKEQWVSLAPEGAPFLEMDTGRGRVPVYLQKERLPDLLRVFFNAKKGLSSLFAERHHAPVYWFQIVGPEGNVVYSSGPKPREERAAAYPMSRSLKGYSVEILYNSFGPKQLYSVARTKINFGVIFFLFLLVIFSAFLVTRAIRQKILLARQKTFFVSTVSHEIKTPLAIMKLAAETLAAKRFKKPEDEQRFQQMLANEINRLNYLVHKILSFNKIEMGQILFLDKEIDLKTILKTSLEVFRIQAVSDRVTLDVAMCEDACPIRGDENLIRHAVDNILDNAFKYRGDSERIEVSCDRGQHEAWIKIRDYGVGIPRQELSQIGKSFYRINDPNIQAVRGSGLGLAISNYILKHSKARLTVESEHRKGSTFTIFFPLRTRPASA